MALEKELKTYREKLPELKAHEGKFVLIHGDRQARFRSTRPPQVRARTTQTNTTYLR
jgi:hypothetical protein